MEGGEAIDYQDFWEDGVRLFHHYEELLAIKKGLTTGWVTDTDEEERVEEILEAPDNHSIGIETEDDNVLNGAGKSLF